VSETPKDSVHAFAEQLRQYATHFAPRDWNYTRETGLVDVVHESDRERRLRGRIQSSLRWLFRRKQGWEDVFEMSRFAMALHVVRRRPNLPDGVLDNGSIITFWEETGEYLQYVQPSIGAMLADWMDADPDSPHAQQIAAEMKRINDEYGARIAAEGNEAA
jgi:hypothetical protein